MVLIAAGVALDEHRDAAPRDSASMPAAPLPAKRSRNAPTADPGLEDREQRLLHPIAERPRPLPGRDEGTAARRARDHPAGAVATPWSGRLHASRSGGARRLGLRDAGEPAATPAPARGLVTGAGARRRRRAAPPRPRAPPRRARDGPRAGARRCAGAAGRSGRGPARRPRGAAPSRARRARSRRAGRATASSRACAVSSRGLRDEHAERRHRRRARRGPGAGGAAPARTGPRPGRSSSSPRARRPRPRPRSCRRARRARRRGSGPSRRRGRRPSSGRGPSRRAAARAARAGARPPPRRRRRDDAGSQKPRLAVGVELERRVGVVAPRPSSISGTTTNVRCPGAASSRTFCHVPSSAFGSADPGPDRDAALRRRAEVGDVEVRVEHLAERPRDRRRGHQQQVRRRARPGLRLERPTAAPPRTGAARR